MSYTLFTVWEYQVSILEFVASVTSLIGVWLGTTGKRITWPFWGLSSALYAVFFYQANLIASAALQFVFIAAALSGWRGWAPTGAKPGKLVLRSRIFALLWILGLWLVLAPFLARIGAAATVVDSFLFVGSLIAQILMVLEKYESWIIWVVVDLAGSALYFNQGYFFTSFLYGIFTLIAFQGWRRWYADQRSAPRPL